MPPPIVPANPSSNRGAPARAPESAPARGPGNPPSPVAPGPPRRAEPAAAPVKPEPPATSAANAVPSAGAPSAQARPAPKAPQATASDWAQKAAEARPPAEKTVAKNDKPSPKVDDPFDDLDSLETEMARLLGREKPD